MIPFTIIKLGIAQSVAQRCADAFSVIEGTGGKQKRTGGET